MHQDKSSQDHVSEQKHSHQPDLVLVAVSRHFLLQGHLHHLVYHALHVGLNRSNYKPHPLQKEDEDTGKKS